MARRDSFLACEESMDDEQGAKTKFSAGSYSPQANGTPEPKWPRRQRSRRHEAPPNGQSGFKSGLALQDWIRGSWADRLGVISSTDC